jgi:predicted NBD/HSP70 family sugar kinase
MIQSVKENKVWVRVIDGGGTGFRRADVCGAEVENIVTTKDAGVVIPTCDSLINFAVKDLDPKKLYSGIAYSMAGLIEDHSRIIKSPNVHFLNGVDLASLTHDKVKRAVAVFNDMDSAVTGMATILSGEKCFMGITWSSGIGLRIWDNGKILSVAEGGHMVLDSSPFALLCGCGKRGHAEAIIGGQSIKRRVVAETEALGIEIPKGIHPCRFLDEEYAREQAWAINLYYVIGENMGIFLANIQTLLHLPLIVWKGTFALNALRSLEPIIRSKMQKVLIDPSWAYEENLSFLITPVPDDRDAMIGAAKAFRKMFFIQDILD